MTASPSIRSIEHRYRRLLHWYPRAWREANGPAVLGVLLEQAEAEGMASPSRREATGLIASGLATRLNALLPSSARSTAALVSLSLGTGFSLAYLLFHAWAPWTDKDALFAYYYVPFGWFVNPGIIFCGLFLISTGFFLCGSTAAGRVGLVATLLSLPAIALLHPATGQWFGPWSVNLWLVGLLCIIALSAPIPCRPRLLALSASISSVLFLGAYLLAGGGTAAYVPDDFFWLHVLRPSALAMLLVVLGFVGLMLRAAGRRHGAVAILLLSVPWMVMCAYFSVQGRLDVATAAGRFAAVLALGEFLTLAVISCVPSRSRRRLQPTP